ncbi:MAG: tRNA 2-thiocytidine(32) synthetase TtcA [Clostridiales bacterium]|nr:tRNA 2-thiocytidine(32) synthetase TtcA [Clostridiales bacterium]
MQRLLGEIRRADQEWGLIPEGAKVALGVSGGKDSMAMLLLLSAYRRVKAFSPVVLTLIPDAEWDCSPVRELCDREGIPFFAVGDGYMNIVRQSDRPCSLCARVRRGTLVRYAREHGCDRLALAHNRDDMLETLMMNSLRCGRIDTMRPAALMEREGVTVIRPLINVKEQQLARLCQREHLVICKNPCPYDGHTGRQEMKELLEKLEKQIPGAGDSLTGGALALFAESAGQNE